MKKFYIFDIITTFHLISALAFCFSKANRGDVVTAYYVKDMDSKYQLSDFEFVDEQGVFIRIKKQEKHTGVLTIITPIWRRFKACGELDLTVYLGHHTYYKPSVTQMIEDFYLLPRCNFKSFSFEEGIGTYNSYAQERGVAIREKKRFFAVKFILKKILKSKLFLDYEWGIFSRKNGARRYYQKSVDAILNYYYLPRKKIEEINNLININISDRVLYFTSPFVRVGVMSDHEYRLFFKDVVDYFKRRGTLLAIKPHPLDNFCYSEVAPEALVVDIDMPAELMIKKFNITKVAGINSTALLTASLIFNCSSINLVELLPESVKKNIALGNNLEEIFERVVIKSDDWDKML
ncbi:alpha-2,8-polysialyltransferase family protein [Halomonas sp. H10-59]|uniref:Alpha-2,8-polysialyltransferase family protein n=1 Tax=Halomonas sp. H10-59 TaxID=2950874 RepID=A0AAU7KZ10_9GAMM